jgi:2-methylisocitrate lyase-like PEP mutase family enzyme
VPTQLDKTRTFLSLHNAGSPLLLPNPWDVGSAKLLASLGFHALATTSGGFAATLGHLDGTVTSDEALAHVRSIVEATDLPVSADLENGFADDPSAVAQTVRRAVEAGVAGCSIEDATGRPDAPVYDMARAVDRIAAAAEAAHEGGVHAVLTARAENHLYGLHNLADTIARLQRYQDAGADVLYAPGLTSLDDIRLLVDSVDRPVNVLVRPTAPTVSELAAVAVSRISVGSAFANAALGAVVQASRELLDEGTYRFFELAGPGASAGRAAFGA